MTADPQLAIVAGWVGKSYADMEALFPRHGGAPSLQWQAGMRGCWNLYRAAESLRGNAIPEEYHAALDARLFRTVYELQPWDLIPICNHRLSIVTHVALYFGASLMVHALEVYGVVSQPITREPWWSRIARDESGRRGYLRLRHHREWPTSPLDHIGVGN
jgi:cell wall-associated NlpC family hydrolase